jgi:hypothetical protein
MLVQAALQSEGVRAAEGLPVLQARPGDPLCLTLTWRGPLKALRAAKVFVHIGAPGQPPRLPQDRLPRDG